MTACPRHKLLLGAYVLDRTGCYDYVIDTTDQTVLCVKGYRPANASTAAEVSVRALRGVPYVRLLDAPAARIPGLLTVSDIVSAACPVCYLAANLGKLPSAVRAFVDECQHRFSNNIGLSGSCLVGATDPRDFDLVFYDIPSPASMADALAEVRDTLGFELVSKWRRFSRDGVTIDVTIEAPHRDALFARIPWQRLHDIEPQFMDLDITGDTHGCGYPVSYICREPGTSARASNGEMLLLSTRPGHAGLVRCGDRIRAHCYVFGDLRPPLAVVDPAGSWIDVEPTTSE